MSTSNLLSQDFDSDEDDQDFDAGNANDDLDAEGEPDDEALAAPGGNVDEEEEEEDDEEDEEEEEDDDDDLPQRKRARKPARNQFLDLEADVSDEDEEDGDEEEDDRAEDGFIDRPDIHDLHQYPRDDHRHRELDRQHEAEQAEDMEKLAAGFKERHGRSSRRRMEDSRVVPRRLLLPSVNDPSIWGVKCKPGKEREVIWSILKKQEELSYTQNPMQITSAFERGNTMPGYIYVEAKKQADVQQALQGISNVYPMTKMILVPIKEMPDLMYVVKKAEITPGTWVRFKRGKYQGDLAQVINVLASGLEVRIKMVPRLDYGNGRDGEDVAAMKRKRNPFSKTNSLIGRPPQRLFSEVEARKNHAKYLVQVNNISLGKKVFTYLGDEYADGYYFKDVKLSFIQTENVNPTLEEVSKFATGGEDGTESLDLNALAQSMKKNVSTYQVGDTVEVYHGEQSGLVGKAVNVHGDIVTLDVLEGPLKGTRTEVPFRGLRKRFRPGDHVKITGGRYRDEVGMVVRITEDRVTILSDLNMVEITVFSKDLKKASDTAGGHTGGKYSLHDLVQLNATTVACVTKVDRESLRILDQHGNSRVIVPSQISNKLTDRRPGIATDRNGSEIRIGDTVKETGGETRTGVILHIFRAFAFLHNREQTDSSGVFVCRTNNVATIAAKGGRITSPQNTGPDLTKMNPSLQRNGRPVDNAAMPPPKTSGRDRTIGQSVSICSGPYKGLVGIIKDANDISARVELHSKNKTISVEKSKLSFRDPSTGALRSYTEFIRPGGRGDSRGFSRTPSSTPGRSTPWTGSRTPQVDYSGGRTPAWMSNSGNKTPAWMSGNDGGRTPAYPSGSKTPAWGLDGGRTSYAGNKTPAWNPSSRTPYVADSDRSAWDAGSKTPGRPPTDSFMDSNAASNSGATGNPTYSPSTPAPYNAPSSPEFIPPSYNSNKELSAPTPGGPISAPTPLTSGVGSAPTPGPVTAPTPREGYGGGWGGPETAPTPAPYGAAAPTPGASGAYGGSNRDPRGAGYWHGAPTPAAGYGNPRTPGVWAGGDDDEPRYAEPTTP